MAEKTCRPFCELCLVRYLGAIFTHSEPPTSGSVSSSRGRPCRSLRWGLNAEASPPLRSQWCYFRLAVVGGEYGPPAIPGHKSRASALRSWRQLAQILNVSPLPSSYLDLNLPQSLFPEMGQLHSRVQLAARPSPFAAVQVVDEDPVGPLLRLGMGQDTTTPLLSSTDYIWRLPIMGGPSTQKRHRGRGSEVRDAV